MTAARLFKRDPSGFTIVVPDETCDIMPLCCPCCTVAFRTKDDERSYQLHKCCSSCEAEWVHASPVEWAAGKRPERTRIEAAVAARPGIAVRIDVV